MTVGGRTSGSATTALTKVFHRDGLNASHQASGVETMSNTAVVTEASLRVSSTAPISASLTFVRRQIPSGANYVSSTFAS